MGDGYDEHLGAASGYLVASAFRNQFREAWFDPEFWGKKVEPVAQGGRGSAWFIHSEKGALVLRHFCRGGLPGRFIRREYVYTGSDSVRSVTEFRLLHTLFHRGFPVPEPIAAGYRRRALLLYQAA